MILFYYYIKSSIIKLLTKSSKAIDLLVGPIHNNKSVGFIVCQGEILMKDSEVLRKRMSALSMSIDDLSAKSFVDKTDIELILDSKKNFTEMDDFDIRLLAGALSCSTEFFFSESARERDMIASSYNRGSDDSRSISAKGKIQSFVRDFVFLENLLKTE